MSDIIALADHFKVVRHGRQILDERQDDAPAKSDWRSREAVQKDIQAHEAARDRFAKGGGMAGGR
jgi:hypothetical protein